MVNMFEEGVCEESAAGEGPVETQSAVPEVTPEEEDKNAHLKIPVSLPVAISCREDLDKIVAEHRVWLDSVVHPKKKMVGGRANLKGADLSGYDLRGINLSGATMIGVNLANADMSGSNFTAADFTGANLKGANLANARLRRAVLKDADVSDANLTDVDFRQAVLENIIGMVKPEATTEGPVSNE